MNGEALCQTARPAAARQHRPCLRRLFPCRARFPKGPGAALLCDALTKAPARATLSPRPLPQGATMTRFFPLLVLALLLLPFPARAFDDGVDKLNFTTPDTFTELTDHECDLFKDTEEQAVSHGRLIKMYLPQYMAHQYRYGSRDAVTRQVLICAMEGQKRPLTQKDAELLARSTEGLFIGFSRIPRSRTDTPAQEMENREKALERALETGSPLLVDSLRTSSAFLYTCLIHYNMMERGPKSWLSTAMATAVVPVKDTVLFVTVSSILGHDNPEPHLDWVKETAGTFADMIVRANKAEKK